MGGGVSELTITEPTVIADLPERDYHGHPGSLSASGAKWLAPPAPCPAKYVWHRDNPVHKDVFDFGHVAHRLVLGKGADIAVVDAEDWRAKAAREAKEEARAAGRVPILARDHAKAEALAASVLSDPVAGPLFAAGDAEVSLFWPDDRRPDVTRRARFDWLTPTVEGRRRFIVDLKTARSSEPDQFGKAAADYGYAISAAQYVDGAIACGLDVDPVFLLVVVEKDEPHVVTTFQVDDDLLQLGRSLMRSAIDLFAECTANDHWPGYRSDVTPLALPPYFHNRVEEALTA